MSTGEAAVAAGRQAFLSRFAWHAGHADVWRAFEDAHTLSAVVDALAAPWYDRGITAVAGIESRGFLLGGSVAVRLGVGFHAIRKSGALFAGDKVAVESEPDYRGLRQRLAMRTSLSGDDNVLLVDDWAEKGAQALAARALVTKAGARWGGVSIIVDQLPSKLRSHLGPVTALVTADELGPADG